MIHREIRGEIVSLKNLLKIYFKTNLPPLNRVLLVECVQVILIERRMDES